MGLIPRSVTPTPADLAARDAQIAALTSQLAARLEYSAELERQLHQTAPPDAAGHVAWPKPYVLQVFWKTASADYTETNSRRVLLPAHGGSQSCSYPLPPTALGPLRIDPGEEPGFWSVFSITLHAIDDQGTLVNPPLVDCSPANGFQGLTLGRGTLSLTPPTLAATARDLLAYGDDPQLVLQIPPRSDDRPWLLRFQCRLNDIPQWFGRSYFTNVTAALAAAQRDIDRLTARLAQLESAGHTAPPPQSWLSRLRRAFTAP